MALYLYKQKYEQYIKNILTLRKIGSMPENTCEHRVLGYLQCLVDNKKIDMSEKTKLFIQFEQKLNTVKQLGRKRMG